MNLIEIRLRELGQLFNSMDPTPFPRKDLDPDAEEFMVSWALEHPSASEFSLIIHLEHSPPQADAEARATEAVHNYFAYRVEVLTRELGQLMHRGRVSMIIGLAFLAACIFVADLIGANSTSTIAGIIRESLTIGGWVAMWRPLQIFLYDWWPLTARRRTLKKFVAAPVQLKVRAVINQNG